MDPAMTGPTQKNQVRRVGTQRHIRKRDNVMDMKGSPSTTVRVLTAVLAGSGISVPHKLGDLALFKRGIEGLAFRCCAAPPVRVEGTALPKHRVVLAS
jgi:hypothetical protein